MKKMKVLSLLLALLLVLSSVSVAFAEEAVVTSETVEGETPVVEVLPKKVKLNKTSLKLEMYSGFQLEAFVTPTEATDQTVFYESNKPSVATVSEDGYIQALSKGKATITAKTVNGKKATCKVTVKKGPEMDAWSQRIYSSEFYAAKQWGKTISAYSKTLSKAANYCIVKYFAEHPNSTKYLDGMNGYEKNAYAQEALDMFGITGTLISIGYTSQQTTYNSKGECLNTFVPSNDILVMSSTNPVNPKNDWFRDSRYMGISVVNFDTFSCVMTISMCEDYAVSETQLAKDWTTTYMRVATPKDIVPPIPIA